LSHLGVKLFANERKLDMDAITDPEDIELFRLLTIRQGLKLEVESGLVHSRGNLVLQRAREALEMYGYKAKRNKKDVLVQMNKLLSAGNVLIPVPQNEWIKNGQQ